MKNENKRSSSTYIPPRTPSELLDRMTLMLDCDLEDPAIGLHSGNLLKTAKEWGYDFQYPSEECPECAPCVFMSLMSACSAVEADQKH